MYLFSFLRTRPPVPQKLSHKFTSNIKPMSKAFACFVFLTTFSALKSAAQAGFAERRDSLVISLRTTVLPQNFYNQHKGVVCKMEDQLQRKAGLPIVIRLGSKSYVDYLEGKPHAPKP